MKKTIISLLLVICFICGIATANINIAQAQTETTSRWGGGTVYLGGYLNCAVKPISGCTYAFYVYKGSQAVYKGAYSSTPKVSYKPSTIGTYKVRAFFKYTNGKRTFSTSNIYNVIKAPALDPSNNLDKHGMCLGDTFVVTTRARGGIAPYSYASYVYKNDVCIYKGSYTKYMTYRYFPTSAGTYHVVRFVKDSLGNKVAKASEKINVEPVSPQYKALIVGTYKDKISLMDYNNMYNLLTTKEPYSSIPVKKVIGQSASQVLANIRSHFTYTTQSSVSIFYFTGSGKSDGSLICAGETFLSPATLANELKKLNGKVIVILDSSYSGNYINKGASFNQSVINTFAAVDTKAKVGEMLTNKFHVITATSKDGFNGVSLIDGSNLTASICSAKDLNNGGFISMAEAYDYAKYIASLLTNGGQKIQCYPLNDNLIFYKK